MKNKLTQEEQLLRDKLEQASFDYQEADWQEVNQQLDSSGGMGKYNLLIKAAAGLALIAAIAFLFQTYYESEKVEVSENTTSEIPLDAEPDQAEKNAVKEQKVTKDLQQKEDHVAQEPSTISNGSSLEEKSESGSAHDEKQKGEQFSDEEKTDENLVEIENKEANNTTLNTDDKRNVSPLEIAIKGNQCVGETIELNVNNPTDQEQEVEYHWSFNHKKIPNTEATVQYTIKDSSPLLVQVKAIISSETVDEYEKTLKPEEPIAIDFTYRDLEDPFYDFSVELKAEDQALENYSWQIDGSEEKNIGKQTTFHFDNKGIYDVTLRYKSENGCISSLSKPVSVKKDFEPYPPNAFTPDGDGINDVFLIESFGLRNDLFEMAIYDVKGNVLFFTRSSEEGWNGRMNNRGEMMPRGTYVWKVKIENEEGVQKSFAGRFKLLDF